MASLSVCWKSDGHTRTLHPLQTTTDLEREEELLPHREVVGVAGGGVEVVGALNELGSKGVVVAELCLGCGDVCVRVC